MKDIFGTERDGNGKKIGTPQGASELKDVVIRCLLTNNPCGTDTWPTGETCKCDNCQTYMERAFYEAAQKLGW